LLQMHWLLPSHRLLPFPILAICDLLQGDFKDRRALGRHGPAADPATVVVGMDANHLKQATAVEEPDAVALLKAGPGSLVGNPAALES
ncbi:MAG: hypothetical protein AB8E74_06720, partial [Prochlorococcus sp.]